jgi:hypothetical protein
MIAVDYSFARPPLAALKAAGVVGVLRYVCSLPNAKAITLAEADAIRGAQLGLGLVWENSPGSWRGGHAQGLSDGTEARKQATAVGFPALRPIYAAYDQLVTDADTSTALAYQAGFNLANGGPQGAYAEALLLDRMFAGNYICVGWQTNATSWPGNAVDDPRAALHQRYNVQLPGVPVGSIDVDEINLADWGQDPKPTPLSVPPAPPVHLGDTVTRIEAKISIDQGGNGWKNVCPWGKFVAATPQGSRPQADGYGYVATLAVTENEGQAELEVRNAKPLSVLTVYVTVSA